MVLTAVLVQTSAAQVAAPHQLGFLGSIDEFDNFVLHQSSVTGKTRIFLGDIHGFLHVYERTEGVYREVWLSEYYEGSIGGIELADANGDGFDEIILYTKTGRIYFLDIEDYTTLWANPVDEYDDITCMIIHDVDGDVNPELIFVADGRLVYYDGRSHFEEWRSDEDGIVATDIVIGDVDGDDEEEIVLNDGNVYDARHPILEWQYQQSLGQRMGLLDIDGDGALELIGEYEDRFLRVFDMDLQRMQNINR